MRNPNGYGSVSKLSGVRRKPYMVRKSSKIIGYFATRADALIALAEYNKSPWDIDKEKTTFKELFELWKEKKLPKLGVSNGMNTKSAYKYCANLTNLKYKDIKSFNMQDCVDKCGHGYATQMFIKNLFKHLDKLAFELDIINKCYSDLIVVEPAPESSKKPFSEEEIKKLWEIKDEPWVDTVLIFLYTGFRISELLDIKAENVDLGTGTIKGGTKTKAGKSRVVPIHSKIYHFIEKRLLNSGKNLITEEGKSIGKNRYYKIWKEIMLRCEMDHAPHECRHTFRSRLDSAGANKKCIDLIMGHKSKDVGERIYTHKTIDELKKTIELLE